LGARQCVQGTRNATRSVSARGDTTSRSCGGGHTTISPARLPCNVIFTLDYYDLARQAVLDLLDREHAAIWLEIEAKLADRPHPLLPGSFNPHHFTNVRRVMTQLQRIEQIAAVTRGGRSVAVLAIRDRHGRQTVFQRAVARKRLLQASYLGWSATSGRGANPIAGAGECVARAPLTVW
jgi:hypothetical protein